MAVETTTSIVQYAGNESSSTGYPVPFAFFLNADIQVVVIDADGEETLLTLGVDYAITGAGNPAGGEVVTTDPVPASSTVSIFREPPFNQLTTYQEGGPFPASSHEAALDRLAMMAQSLQRRVLRSFRVTDSSPEFPPIAIQNPAGRVLGFDLEGASQLYSFDELRALLELPGPIFDRTTRVFLTDTDRNAAVPAFVGQFGFQFDDKGVYIADDFFNPQWILWTLPNTALGNDQRRPPTQHAVKTYADGVGTAAATDATTKADAAQGAAIAHADSLASLLGVNAGEMVPQATNGMRPVVLAGGFDGYAADDTVAESAFWTGRPSPPWTAELRVRALWRSTAGSGAVRWGFQAQRFDHDDALTTATPSTTAEVTSSQTAANDLIVSGWVNIDVTGAGPLFRLFSQRSAAHGDDTLVGDAVLLAVEIDLRP